jgi:hypothetical protein
MEDYDPYKISIESDLESVYVKMCRKKMKAHVAYMDKLGKTT